MLLSALISLTPTDHSPVLGSLGRPAQGWFLRQVTRHSAPWGSKLHLSNSIHPYTVSTLLDDRGRPLRPGSWLKPGKSVWLRLTSTSEELSAFLLEKVFPKLPNRLELYKMNFRIDGYTTDPAQHPWACQSSIQALAQDSKLNHVNGRVRLEFISPTAFRSNGADVPIPDPSKLMRSYWMKWNAVVPEDMQISVNSRLTFTTHSRVMFTRHSRADVYHPQPGAGQFFHSKLVRRRWV